MASSNKITRSTFVHHVLKVAGVTAVIAFCAFLLGMVPTIIENSTVTGWLLFLGFGLALYLLRMFFGYVRGRIADWKGRLNPLSARRFNSILHLLSIIMWMLMGVFLFWVYLKGDRIALFLVSVAYAYSLYLTYKEKMTVPD